MGRLSSLAVTVLITFVSNVLKRSANSLWDELWEYIFEAVVQAEEKWGDDNGAAKKEFAMDLIMGWLDENMALNWLQRTAIRLVVSNLLNGLIKEFNNIVGHDWLAKAKEVKEQLGDRIPFIE